MIIFNDKLRQTLVKEIPLNIQAKRKLKDTLGHKDHSTHSPHPHSLFSNLTQISTTPPPTNSTILYRTASTLADVKKGDEISLETTYLQYCSLY
jgi:hypothetical protein